MDPRTARLMEMGRRLNIFAPAGYVEGESEEGVPEEVDSAEETTPLPVPSELMSVVVNERRA